MSKLPKREEVLEVLRMSEAVRAQSPVVGRMMCEVIRALAAAVPCERCGGTRRVQDDRVPDKYVLHNSKKCPDCNGTGKAYDLEGKP